MYVTCVAARTAAGRSRAAAGTPHVSPLTYVAGSGGRHTTAAAWIYVACLAIGTAVGRVEAAIGALYAIRPA